MNADSLPFENWGISIRFYIEMAESFFQKKIMTSISSGISKFPISLQTASETLLGFGMW